jgi:hypothetical protein
METPVPANIAVSTIPIFVRNMECSSLAPKIIPDTGFPEDKERT